MDGFARCKKCNMTNGSMETLTIGNERKYKIQCNNCDNATEYYSNKSDAMIMWDMENLFWEIEG